MQDGAIQIAVGATGIDQVNAVKSRTADDDVAGKDRAYGHLIAENTVGVNHDHYFSSRLDLDVDGTANSLVRDRWFRSACRRTIREKASGWWTL
jgi:primary-amine oxidase